MMGGGFGITLDDDGINPGRALILQAYWALRRTRTPKDIGTAEIAAWIRAHEPDVVVPSPSLILLTLDQAPVPHRTVGRPARGQPPPFCPVRTQPPKVRRRR